MEQQSLIIKVDHIAIVSKQEKKIRKLFNEIGFLLTCGGIVPEIEVNCDYYSIGNVDIEIVSPTSENSIVINHYTKYTSSPLHHIAFEVTSIKKGVAFFKKKGYYPINGNVYLAPKENHKVIFLSPIQTGGLLVELVSNND